MDKCTSCGALNDLFASACYKCRSPLGGGATTAVAERARLDQNANCDSCRQPLTALATFSRRCPNCGWDNDRRIRKCIHCDGVVVFDEAEAGRSRSGGPEAAWSISGVVGAVIGQEMGKAMGYHFGILGVGGLGFGIIAFGCFFRAALTGYRCTSCGKNPSASLLSRVERRGLASYRLRWWLMTAALTAVAVGCMVARAAIVAGR